MAQTVVTKKTAARKAPPAKPAPVTPIIDIEDEEKPIPVRLIGVDYTAHRPKSMLAVRLGQQVQAADPTDPEAVVGHVRSFLALVFGSDETDAIMARLEDPDDRLDVPHLLTFIERMTEVVSGRPPTSPPASAN